MLYTRHQLDKAGDDLIGSDLLKSTAALLKVQKWRETHVGVAQELNRQILALFESGNVVYDFPSMRIKRMTSIIAKLSNYAEKRTKLGGMYDIGGLRFVFSDMTTLNEAIKVLDKFSPVGFSFTKKKDYISDPKESGYRSIHYIYKRISEDNTENGNSIEVQVRTRLQHAWAMAVETASLIAKTSLKADIDDKSEWRNFFRLVSALFAREENSPVYETFKDYDEVKLCEEYFHYEKSKLVDQLSALGVVTDTLDYDKTGSGYCVLNIDFNTKTVSANTFSPEEGNKATEFFSALESKIDDSSAALMVAIENMREIREAYPSYFLDTKKFIEYLTVFKNNCRFIMNKK